MVYYIIKSIIFVSTRVTHRVVNVCLSFKVFHHNPRLGHVINKSRKKKDYDGK